MARVMNRRPFSSAIGLLAVLVGVLSPATAAHGQVPGSVELIAQTAWVDPGGIFDVQVRAVGADPDSTVELRVHEPWSDRQAFLSTTIDGNPLPDGPPRLELGPLALRDLQETSNEILSFAIQVNDPDRPTVVGEDLPVIDVAAEPAIHPVEIVLLRPDGEVDDRLLTAMITLPRRIEALPMQTLFVYDHVGRTRVLGDTTPLDTTPLDTAPLDTAPLDTAPDGVSVDVADLTALVDALDTHPNAPIALRIEPARLERLAAADDAETTQLIERLRNRLGANELLPASWVSVDEQAWVDAELDDALDLLVDRGADTIETTLGSRPQTAVAIVDPTTTSAGLDTLVDRGAAGVLVEPGGVSSLDRSVFGGSLSTRFVISSADGRSVPALEADVDLRRHFGSTSSAALDANRILADLTLLALEQPEVRQSSVVWPEPSWPVDRNVLNIVLSGIERIPVLVAADAVDVMTDTAFTPATGVGTVAAPLRRTIRADDASPLGPYRTEFTQARASIASWGDVIVGDPDGASELETLLLRSADRHLAETDRQAFIEDIYRRIDDQKNGAISAPAAETITFTTRDPVVPIVIENNFGFAADVALLFDSEKLEFPDGRQVDIRLEPGTNRVDVPVLARASGDSPIRIQVLSPDRVVLLSSSEVVVRTFAVSGVGVVIGAIAIVVLLAWWLRHRRATRSRVAPHPSDIVPEDHAIGVQT